MSTREHKVLICGDRNWDNVEVIEEFVSLLNANTVVIQGEARGADTIARDAAKKRGLTVLSFPANWSKHHKAAGPIRNREMLQEKPNLVVGFHNNIFDSKGTKDMISVSRTKGVPYMVISSSRVIYQYGNLQESWIEKLEKSIFRFKGEVMKWVTS